MSDAYYETAARPSRSLLDRLADHAPRSLRHPAGALALAADRSATAYEKARTAARPALAHLRRRRVPYTLAALGIGIGVGLLLYKPNRRAAADLAREGWNRVHDGLGRELARELRSFATRGS